MRNFFPDEQVAASKAEWEPGLRAFAKTTNKELEQSRRLPIYDQAVEMAKDWLAKAVRTTRRERHETLVVTGDEHLHAAFKQTPVPKGALFLYAQAWAYWHRAMFLGEVPWWASIYWAINGDDQIIEVTHHLEHDLNLVAGQTFLCTERYPHGGAHRLLKLIDGRLESEPISEWIDS